MSDTSSIEWTQSTWNPLTGCTKISRGCKNCYAEIMARRLKAMGSAKYAKGFELTLHPGVLEAPLAWKKPRVVFVNSMSDLFHEDVPIDFIHKVFSVMRKAPQHRFQILTKRAERLHQLRSRLSWPNNVWMGVTVESSDYGYRIDYLRETGAALKFLSLEPLLEAVHNLDLNGIDWVILGGESGPRARPLRHEWVADVRDQCIEAAIPFFFKQWGGRRRRKEGRLLDGRIWDQMPGRLVEEQDHRKK